MACRTGCRTQDHATWGDCLRASNIQMNAGDAASGKAMSNAKWNGELDAYANARAQGIQAGSLVWVKSSRLKRLVKLWAGRMTQVLCQPQRQ